VAVVAAVSTVLDSFLDAFPAVPDAFPGVLASSDFAFRASCWSFVVASTFVRRPLDRS
jgi:hypothetical protein